jgi:hypothetical protein
VPRPRLLARIKIGRVYIDVYDPSTLEALLEWAVRVGAEGVDARSEAPPAAERRAEPAGELGEPVEIPEFARENPWLAVIAKRG